MPDERERADARSHLLPEEAAAGSDDPQAQAEAILAESDERVAHPERDAMTAKQTIPVTPEPDPPA